MSKALIFAVILFSLTGCSELTSCPVAVGTEHSKKGFIYYEPAQYIVVKPSIKDGTTTSYDISFVMLPDYEHPHLLTIHPGIGSNEQSFKLDDGWKLTSVDSKTDTQIPQTISAATDLVKAGLGITSAGDEIKAGVYKMDIDPKNGKVLQFTKVNFVLK